MEFNHFFQINESPTFKVYGNIHIHEWECGGAFGSDWSKRSWYEGILLGFEGNKELYFFFKTYHVRDEELPPFIRETLFGDMTPVEILKKCKELGKKSSKSPFLFLDIDRTFASIEHT